MEIDRKELKRQAREAMKLTNPRFWLVTLVYILMTTGLSILVNNVFPVNMLGSLGLFSVFITFFITLYTWVVRFGFDLWTLWSWRKLDPGMGSLLQGFTVTGRVIVMNLVIFLRTLGWAFLFSLLAAPFVLVSPILAGLGAVAAALAAMFVTLRYSLAPYLLADHPDDGASAAIRRSVMLMNGWTWELCKLELSFLGWMVLEALLEVGVMLVLFWVSGGLAHLLLGNVQLMYVQITAMVNSLSYALLSILVRLPLLMWLYPYRGVSRAGFYENRLKVQMEEAPEL